jgi:hypothetical protein
MPAPGTPCLHFHFALLQLQILGTVYARMLPEGWATAANIVAMLQLNNALKFGELAPRR